MSGPGLRVAVTNVNVVDVATGDVRRDHGILIEDGRIRQVAPMHEVTIDGAELVDGRDRYAVPGLADMHVHFWDVGEAAMYLANGVTTVRNMFGAPFHLALSRRIDAGEILGPRLVTTSPIVDGATESGGPMWPGSALVVDDASAHAFVEACVDRGYAAIKAYSFLSVAALDALGRASAAAGLPLVGHCPRTVTVGRAIDAGQSCFEHFTAIEVGNLLTEDPPPTDRIGRLRQMTTHLDLESVRLLARRCADEEIWNCPTTTVERGIATSAEDRRGDPTLDYLTAATLATWNPANDFRFRTTPFSEYAAAQMAWADRHEDVLRIFIEEGAPLLIGTDNPNPWVVPGFSLHDELASFVACGMSPLAALRAATLDAARFLGEAGDWGNVQEGARADLVLCEDNPLEDLGTLRRPMAVVARGRLFDRDALDRMLTTRKADAQKSPTFEPDDLPQTASTVRHTGTLRRTLAGEPVGCCHFRHVATDAGRELVEEDSVSQSWGGNMVERRRARVVLQNGGAVESTTATVDHDVGSWSLHLHRGDAGHRVEVRDVDGRNWTADLGEATVCVTDRISASAFVATVRSVALSQTSVDVVALDVDDIGQPVVGSAQIQRVSEDAWHVHLDRGPSAVTIEVRIDEDNRLRAIREDSPMGTLETRPNALFSHAPPTPE